MTITRRVFERSRFNTLYHGEPDRAADALEQGDSDFPKAVTPDELRIALINALRRIHQLERCIARLSGDHK